jgi:hypothetical protein
VLMPCGKVFQLGGHSVPPLAVELLRAARRDSSFITISGIREPRDEIGAHDEFQWSVISLAPT